MNLEFEVDLPRRDNRETYIATLRNEIEELKNKASELEEHIKLFGSTMPKEDEARLKSLL